METAGREWSPRESGCHGQARGLLLDGANPGYGELSWAEWVGVVVLAPVYALCMDREFLYRNAVRLG